MIDVPGVCFEPEELRELKDGTTVRVRYKTTKSSYTNEQSIEGAVRVVDRAVHVGGYKVYTSNALNNARTRGEVVQKRTTGDHTLGIFHRAEVQDEY